MDVTVLPGKLQGTVRAIPSKSQAHRVLICLAFSDNETEIICPQTNDDIDATAQCLCMLGANISRTDNGYLVKPVRSIPTNAVLDCKESGSTLRFMLPIAGALGVDATFILSGRLPMRPLSPLWEEMERMGCELSRPTENTIRCNGKLLSGIYEINGSVSSQFITGLLFATALIPGQSQIKITGTLESGPYVNMTQQVLSLFGVKSEQYTVVGTYPFTTPKVYTVEGDWSNGAFFLAAKALGNSLNIDGLDTKSVQGDRVCDSILDGLTKENLTIDCKDIPDLVPILAVTAAANKGATLQNIARLRLKESDRVDSVINMLRSFGAKCATDNNTMFISPAQLRGGTIDAVNDHRIAMAAAIAATVASGPVTILGADCVKKSYPSFWDEFKQLGGHYEQYIR